MEFSKLSSKQKNILGELEKILEFSLKKDLEENKFMIMEWKWVIRFEDFELYNKIAEKLEREKAKNKYDSKKFSFKIGEHGQYNFWFNI